VCGRKFFCFGKGSFVEEGLGAWGLWGVAEFGRVGVPSVAFVKNCFHSAVCSVGDTAFLAADVSRIIQQKLRVALRQKARIALRIAVHIGFASGNPVDGSQEDQDDDTGDECHAAEKSEYELEGCHRISGWNWE
jgi:hypothetical protein